MPRVVGNAALRMHDPDGAAKLPDPRQSGRAPTAVKMNPLVREVSA